MNRLTYYEIIINNKKGEGKAGKPVTDCTMTGKGQD